MGAIAAEAREHSLRSRISENQALPDSKARVRFLLDEIALLQSRFENKDHYGGTNDVLRTEDLNRAESDCKTEQVSSKDAATLAIDVKNGGEGPDVGYQEIVQVLEEKVRTFLEERMWFFENAERELRVGKVQKSGLATLLQLEKSKLQRQRKELDNVVKNTMPQTADVATYAQDLLGKLASLLDERENLHLKFEVQVELGHFFRLLKLLELQKAKHDISRREVEKSLHELKHYMEHLPGEGDKDGGEVASIETMEQTFSDDKAGVCDANEFTSESLHEDGESAVGPHEYISLPTDERPSSDSECLPSYQEECFKSKKEAKSTVLKLMAAQEQEWKTQQAVLQEMQRRLEVTELESQRLRNILEERDNRCDYRRETTAISWTANLPLGYSSIYYSPIFQERKSNTKHSKDVGDAEIFRLKAEIHELRTRLDRKEGKEQSFLDRIQVPSVEKTISVDASSNKNATNKILEVISAPSECSPQTSDCTFSEDDKRSSVDTEGTYVESIKNLDHQGDFLMKSRTADFETVDAPEAQIRSIKEEMASAADQYAQQLDKKERTLAYAQDLNLQLANDMSKTENALAELRVEYTALKASLETKIKDSENKAEEIAKTWRMKIETLETDLHHRDNLLKDMTGRVEACQKETDAAVLEKNEVLKRLQRVIDELEDQNIKILTLEDELKACQSKQDEALVELEEAKDNLKDKINEHEIEEHESLGHRFSQLQARLLETEYQLSQREEALERLTRHLAASAMQEHYQRLEESNRESLRSKHRKKERAKKSIEEVEERMSSMAAEMARAKLEMEDLRSQSFQLFSARTGRH